MGFIKIYKSNKEKTITQEEVAVLLGISERQFRCKKQRYEQSDYDPFSLLDHRIDKSPPNKISSKTQDEIEQLFRTRYFDFNTLHLYKKLRSKHKKTVSYSWTKNFLQSKRLIDKTKKRIKHRLKRERKPMVDMMIHQDASTHDWFGQGDKIDLVLTLDDASNEIYSMFLVEQEGTQSSFRGLYETFNKYGLANYVYTDRGSHYQTAFKKNIESPGDMQVERALKQLSITMIHANLHRLEVDLRECLVHYKIDYLKNSA